MKPKSKFQEEKSNRQQQHKQTQLANSKSCLLADVKMHQFKMLERHKNMSRPILTQQRRQDIERKIQFEKYTSKNITLRIKYNQPFVEFTTNPFSLQPDRKIKKSISRPALSKQPGKIKQGQYSLTPNKEDKKIAVPQERNIVNAINDIKLSKESTLNRDKLKQIFNKTADISASLQRLVHQSKTSKTKSQIQKKTDLIDERQMSFDEIIKMHDLNFYNQNQKEINIFKFLRKNSGQYLTKDQLNKYYFSHNSFVDKLNRYKFPIMREISKQSRDLVLNISMPKSMRLELLNSNELTFNQSNLKFVDLLGVSSGRLNPQLVYDVLNDRHAQTGDANQSSIVDEEQTINYKDGEVNKAINFDLQNRQKIQNWDYLKLEKNLPEQKYHKKYQKIKKDTKKQLQIVKSIIQTTVKDKSLHQNCSNKVMDNLQCILNMDNQVFESCDHKIRSNKINKNCQERLKIKQLLNTLQLKNSYEQKFRQLLAPSQPQR